MLGDGGGSIDLRRMSGEEDGVFGVNRDRGIVAWTDDGFRGSVKMELNTWTWTGVVTRGT